MKTTAGILEDPITPEQLGHAELTPTGAFEAGSYQTFTLTYTCGYFGIDDSGSLRVVFRFAADQTRPQFDDPTGPNYTTIKASNNAVLEYRYDPKGNIRPWDRTLYVKVVRGFMKEGDTITITFGDRSKGSPGMRLQTFCEDTFEFRMLVDPIATFNYQQLPVQPMIRLVPGPAERWVAVCPTERRVGDTFRLSIKAEDKWGNPTDKAQRTLRLRASRPVAGLPETVTFERGKFALHVDGLSVAEPGDVDIEVLGDDDTVLCRANALRIHAAADLVPFWGDLHGQSEETIGTNSARDYFTFARDRAFVDVCGHQGNDFQITRDFWDQLNILTAEFNEPGRFVTLPGYEWSGNTALGGDRNVYYMTDDRPIRRSSHALVEDKSDIESDCNTAAILFRSLRDAGEDSVAFAHCGGRYADVKLAHDGVIEKSMEIHSSWGTFEWLVHDAFEMGYRVGIVGNSDGHKGRPGASYPGAAHFGAIGGLTCLLVPELTRAAVFDCLRKRRHYATTGGRLVMAVTAAFEQDGTLYHEDPALGPSDGVTARQAMMGDIVHLPGGGATLHLDVLGSAPIERVDIFNGLEHLETVRPYAPEELGARVRVIWEGAEYRGRFRQVIWDGSAEFRGNRVVDARPINFFNRDKTLDRVGESGLKWRALTTGNLGGFDAWLGDPAKGEFVLDTPLVKVTLPLEAIGYDDETIEAGGLDRRVRIFRLPAENRHRGVKIERRIDLRESGDNPLFVRVTQEDGHIAWSSPIYVFRKG
jgi:hypothetical protein